MRAQACASGISPHMRTILRAHWQRYGFCGIDTPMLAQRMRTVNFTSKRDGIIITAMIHLEF